LLNWAVNADAGRAKKAQKILTFGKWVMWASLLIMLFTIQCSPYANFSNDGPLGSLVHIYPDWSAMGLLTILAFSSGAIVGILISLIVNWTQNKKKKP